MSTAMKRRQNRSPTQHICVRSQHPILTRAETDARINDSTFQTVNTSSHHDISMNNRVQRENSSDLSSGRRPVSKSVEFFLWTSLLIEKCPTQLFCFFQKRLPFIGASVHDQRVACVRVACKAANQFHQLLVNRINRY